MDPLTLSALISGGLSLAGSLGSMGGSMSSAGDAQDFAEDFAKKKYRWAVKDMRAAGLNPALMFGSGGPGGGGTMPTMTFPNVLEGAAATAREYGTRKADIEKKAAETRIADKQYDLVDQQFNTEVWREQRERSSALYTFELIEKAKQDALVSAATAQNINANTRLTEAQLPGAEALGELYEDYPMLRILQQFSPGSGALVEGLKLIKGKSAPTPEGYRPRTPPPVRRR